MSSLPTYKGSGSFTAGTGAITPPMPTGGAAPAANDILLLVCESENQAISLTTANGFVEVTNSPQGTGTGGSAGSTRIACFWKRAVGSDSAPTVGDPGDHVTGQIHCFAGCKQSGNPWNITAGGVDTTSDTSGSIPGATTTVDHCLIVALCSSSNNGNSTTQFSAWTNANLANVTERTDNTSTSGLGGGHGMATGEFAGTGNYGATAVTLAVSSLKGMLSIALEGLAPTDLGGGPVRMGTRLLGTLGVVLATSLNAAPARAVTRLTTSGMALVYKAAPSRSQVRLTGRLATVVSLPTSPARMMARVTGQVRTTVPLVGVVRAGTRLLGAASTTLAMPAGPVRSTTRLLGAATTTGITAVQVAGTSRALTRLLGELDLLYPMGPVRANMRLTGGLTTTIPLPASPSRIQTRLRGEAFTGLAAPMAGVLRMSTRLLGAATTTVALPAGPARVETRLLGAATATGIGAFDIGGGVVRVQTRLLGQAIGNLFYEARARDVRTCALHRGDVRTVAVKRRQVLTASTHRLLGTSIMDAYTCDNDGGTCDTTLLDASTTKGMR